MVAGFPHHVVVSPCDYNGPIVKGKAHILSFLGSIHVHEVARSGIDSLPLALWLSFTTLVALGRLGLVSCLSYGEQRRTPIQLLRCVEITLIARHAGSIGSGWFKFNFLETNSMFRRRHVG